MVSESQTVFFSWRDNFTRDATLKGILNVAYFYTLLSRYKEYSDIFTLSWSDSVQNLRTL